MSEQEKKLFAKVVHRARRRSRSAYFADLGVRVGDYVRAWCVPMSLDKQHNPTGWTEGKVVDFRVDKLRRRWIILKGGQEVRADGPVTGEAWEKCG